MTNEYAEGLRKTPTLECGHASTPCIGFDIQPVDSAAAASAGPPAGGAGPVGGGPAAGLAPLPGYGHPGPGTVPQGSPQPAHTAPPAAGAAV